MPPILTHDIQTARAQIRVISTTVVDGETVASIGEAVRSMRPDSVVVDYDESRWQWLADPEFRETANLVDVIRNKELAVLNARLAMGILRRLISPPSVDVAEDEEVRVAVETARELGIPVVFARRRVEVEGVRAWRLSTFGARTRLLGGLLTGSLRRTGIEADKAQAALDSYDVQALRNEVTRRAGPVAASVVLDEAERWAAETLRDAEGRVLFLTREVHREGIQAVLQGTQQVVAPLSVVPEKSLVARVVPWAFSAAIIAAFVLGFVFGDFEKMTSALAAWFIANMTMAALGAAAAGGHPWTVVVTSISAPFVSLNPAVGAGMVGSFVQALAAPPSVRDMDHIGDDIAHWRGWWKNRLARVILVFVFANVASTIGSFIALAWFA